MSAWSALRDLIHYLQEVERRGQWFVQGGTYRLGEDVTVTVMPIGTSRRAGVAIYVHSGADAYRSPLVALVTGSASDLPKLARCQETLDQLGIPYETVVLSAHRTPDEVVAYLRNAEARGVQVFIAAAGMAAHLPGVLAAHTLKPVIGVPIGSGILSGLDALLSIVQMPPGVPVAGVGVDAGANAALLAARILQVGYPMLQAELTAFRAQQKAQVLQSTPWVSTLMEAETGLFETHLEGVPLLKRGKVRDIYDLGDHLLIVATDRISVFDVVLPTPIPGKGRILTALSAFWFWKFQDRFPHHLVSTRLMDLPDGLGQRYPYLDGRVMLVRKLRVFPVECVVRGYITGSGWQMYRETGRLLDVVLPPGLREADRLPEPVFTPTTKAETGHDQPLTFDEVVRLVGRKTAETLRDWSLQIYREAADYAEQRGILIADTKFEFGVDEEGRVYIVDELLTPDSSRFWPKDLYEPGRTPPSFDKQYVRDYTSRLGWNKQPPGPPLPPDVVRQTLEKYREAYRRLVPLGAG